MMLDRWIEPTVRHLGQEFTTHEYIERLREICPADYAHDLALCTLKQGFPQSLAVLHKAIVEQLRALDCVKVVGTKESRDIRGNKHQTLVWQRLDSRRPRRKLREPFHSVRRTEGRPPSPARTPPPRMTGAQLQEARLGLGWNKTELARRAGVSLAAVSRWERDERRMGWPTFKAMQRALQAGQAQRERAIRQGRPWPPARPRRRARPRSAPPLSGSELRKARLALGWTMSELARRAGVSPTSVSLWERGKQGMTRRHFEAVRRALEAGQSGRDLGGREVEGSPAVGRGRKRV